MDDDGFVSLGRSREGGGISFVNGRYGYLAKDAVRAIRSPARVRILAHPATGETRLLPATDGEHDAIRLNGSGQFACGSLVTFAKRHGFVPGWYPVEVRDGMVVFRMRKADE